MKRIDPDAILAPLKDFQRRTVDYVFRRMYLDEDLTRRFLVADEVGLGKTMIARGLIAKVIEHLDGQAERIDIVYICSNGSIARQNINRLNILEGNEFVLPSRITLLPTKLKDLNRNKVNFVSLTPATSFDLRSSTGLSDERVLLYHLLEECWNLAVDHVLEIFRGSTRPDNFRRQLTEFDVRSIDPTLREQFLEALKPENERLRKALRGLLVAQDRTKAGGTDEGFSSRCSALIGELRSLLARACIDALEPDLIILDEFQRFKNLLHLDSDAGELANALFNYEDRNTQTRVLLLSATPYKMYTLSHEEDDDHYHDFLKTVEFLVHGDEARLDRIRRSLDEYRLGLLSASGRDPVTGAKQILETELRRVMSRTERLALTPDRNGMLQDVVPLNHTLRASDLKAYLTYQEIARQTGGQNMLEYWKSAPYLLNFMQDYRFKRDFQKALESEAQQEVLRTLHEDRSVLFRRDQYEAYARIDPDNARLRSLSAMTLGVGLWKLLWLPPALPYYQLEEPFRSVADQSLTKRLVFSSWQVVPRVIASFLSYEAERLIHRDGRSFSANTPEERSRFTAPLRFGLRERTPATMSLLALVYPSIRLAELGDPLPKLQKAIEQRQPAPSVSELVDGLAAHIAEYELPALKRKHERTHTGPADEAWYWAAPLLLDLSWYGHQAKEWLRMPDLAATWAQGTDDETESGGDGPSPNAHDAHSSWQSHVARMRQIMRTDEKLGPMPSDLARILAMMALASPAVVALRSLARVVRNEQARKSPSVRVAAGQIAHGFLSLFNLPETVALLRNDAILPQTELGENEPYWQRVLRYCQNGCLQAVLDEYVHLLNESLGLSARSELDRSRALSEAVQAALRIRTVNLAVDDIQLSVRGDILTVDIGAFRMRNRFAFRFGDRDGDTTTEVRVERVRQAFNSPFWPFVLATTSIGQEGLDFHPYCHSVVHWNLPSNPVDLEQREGRVHRYKGHAIRKNVALAHAQDLALASGNGDPWQVMFDAASKHAKSELSPFWIYPLENGVQIQSIVPAFPLSREDALRSDLRQSLAAYRLAFGQPRQEDLVAFLNSQRNGDSSPHSNDEARINLEPPNESVSEAP